MPAEEHHAFVLDGSVTMAWFFADESSTEADAIENSLTRATVMVPALWLLEVANTLLVGERRKRATQAETTRFLHTLNLLPITVEKQTNIETLTEILSLARKHELTAYDAAYLELALRMNLPIATLDQKLKEAAEACGVPLFEG